MGRKSIKFTADALDQPSLPGALEDEPDLEVAEASLLAFWILLETSDRKQTSFQRKSRGQTSD